MFRIEGGYGRLTGYEKDLWVNLNLSDKLSNSQTPLRTRSVAGKADVALVFAGSRRKAYFNAFHPVE